MAVIGINLEHGIEANHALDIYRALGRVFMAPALAADYDDDILTNDPIWDGYNRRGANWEEALRDAEDSFITRKPRSGLDRAILDEPVTDVAGAPILVNTGTETAPVLTPLTLRLGLRLYEPPWDVGSAAELSEINLNLRIHQDIKRKGGIGRRARVTLVVPTGLYERGAPSGNQKQEMLGQYLISRCR